MKTREEQAYRYFLNYINGEGRLSLWPDKMLDWEKLFSVRRQLNANSHSTHDSVVSDAIYYAESKCENHSFLRRDLQASPSDPTQYIGIYMFLCLLFVLFCMSRYVAEEGYTGINSQYFVLSVG